MVTTLRTTPVRPAPGAVAEHLAPLLELVFSGAPPVRFECWDGSSIGPTANSVPNAWKLATRASTTSATKIAP